MGIVPIRAVQRCSNHSYMVKMKKIALPTSYFSKEKRIVGLNQQSNNYVYVHFNLYGINKSIHRINYILNING